MVSVIVKDSGQVIVCVSVSVDVVVSLVVVVVVEYTTCVMGPEGLRV